MIARDSMSFNILSLLRNQWESIDTVFRDAKRKINLLHFHGLKASLLVLNQLLQSGQNQENNLIGFPEKEKEYEIL